MVQNVKFFPDTEGASFCCGVVGFAPIHNVPSEVVVNISSFQIPDVFAKRCLVFIFILEGVLVDPQSRFKISGAKTHIISGVIS